MMEKRNIEKMPPDARTWIYQSNSELTDENVCEISKEGDEFIKSWAAHGANLTASFDIFYNRFVVLAVDEKQAMASGCSIDKSVQFVKHLEKKYNICLLDRTLVAYRKNEAVLCCTLSEFSTMIADHRVDGNTIVFNNLPTTKKDFDSNWEVPLNKSWHKTIIL